MGLWQFRISTSYVIGPCRLNEANQRVKLNKNASLWLGETYLRVKLISSRGGIDQDWAQNSVSVGCLVFWSQKNFSAVAGGSTKSPQLGVYGPTGWLTIYFKWYYRSLSKLINYKKIYREAQKNICQIRNDSKKLFNETIIRLHEWDVFGQIKICIRRNGRFSSHINPTDGLN